MRYQLVAFLLGSLVLPGCSASLRGGSAPPLPEAGQPIGGLPYRLRDQLNVEVYRLTDKGYVLVGTQTELLADPSRLYVLNFEGRPLTDSTLKIDQRPDGTLSLVNLSGSGKGADLATNVAAGLDAIQAANKANMDAKKAAADALAASTTKADDKEKADAAAATEAQLDAVQTRGEVYRLQLKLDEDRASLKPSEVSAAEYAIWIAKMKANTAAVAVGQEIPFPDIK